MSDDNNPAKQDEADEAASTEECQAALITTVKNTFEFLDGKMEGTENWEDVPPDVIQSFTSMMQTILFITSAALAGRCPSVVVAAVDQISAVARFAHDRMGDEVERMGEEQELEKQITMSEVEGENMEEQHDREEGDNASSHEEG